MVIGFKLFAWRSRGGDIILHGKCLYGWIRKREKKDRQISFEPGRDREAEVQLREKYEEQRGVLYYIDAMYIAA